MGAAPWWEPQGWRCLNKERRSLTSYVLEAGGVLVCLPASDDLRPMPPSSLARLGAGDDVPGNGLAPEDILRRGIGAERGEGLLGPSLLPRTYW